MAAELDPRTPVLVGVGQLNVRVDRGEEPLEPVAMLAEAARLAAADSGGATDRLLAGLDTVAVIDILSVRYRDPACLVAGLLGAEPARRWTTVPGGNYPQTLLNKAATDIAAGRSDAVLIGGAEAWRTRSAARKAGTDLGWGVEADDAAPTEHFGVENENLVHPDEVARGIFLPVQLYPLFESAVRAAAGRDQAEHQVVVSEMWARFSEVAAANPSAWIREARTAEEIRTAGPDNRMIGHPYPKLMNSNNSVEQAAALLLTSVERARDLGVPTDRWVFPWSGTDAHDTWYVGNRVSMHRSPAIGIAGARALELAGVGVDDLAHVDVYSCFPSAVQVAAAELGLGLERDLTVTGGLSFAGGPWNDYVSHSIATMAGLLRQAPDEVGFITANGGYLTKHAFGVYAARPPERAFRWHDCQAEVDDIGEVELVTDHEGAVQIEAATVMYDRDGKPETAYIATRTPERHRAWASSTDDDVIALITDDEPVGVAAHRTADGTLTI